MDKGLNNFACDLHLAPISETEFDILFSSILEKDVCQIAVAVSGGPDSLALSWLLHRWCSKVGIRLIALTVDHGLRENSSQDAETVVSWLNSWGVDCKILPWREEKPSTGIQENARIARYNLLLNWCKKNGVLDLAIAHHQEDQAETFLMRVVRGSGANGLACMGLVTRRRGIRLLRPLLTVSKTRLRATLRLQNQKWLEDPANTNPAYTRTLIRNLSVALEKRGLDTQRLAVLAAQFGNLRERLEDITHFVINRVAKIYAMGWASVDHGLLNRLPEEIRKQVLIFLIKSIGGKHYPPRSKRLERVLDLIKNPDQFKASSLGGCSIRQSKNQIIIIREEYSKKKPTPIISTEYLMWRSIFQCKFEGSFDKDSKMLTLAPLGHKGWVELVNEQPKFRTVDVSYRVALTLPALFDDHGLVSVPHLNYNRRNLNTHSNRNGVKFVGAKFLPLDER